MREINKIESFDISICKIILACVCAWFMFKYMSNKYDSTTIARTVLFMTYLIIQTKGKLNNVIIWIVLLFALCIAMCLILDTKETLKEFSLTTPTTFGELNHKDKIEFAKIKYTEYLAKKYNIPTKIALKYTDYSAKYMNSNKTVSLKAIPGKSIRHYYVEISEVPDLKFIYLGTVKIKPKNISINTTKNVEENIKEAEINENVNEEIKEEIEEEIKENVNEEIEEEIKEKVNEDVNNNFEEIKDKFIQNMEQRRDDKLINVIKELMKNTNEKLTEQIMEIFNNYNKQKAINIEINDNVILNN